MLYQIWILRQGQLFKLFILFLRQFLSNFHIVAACIGLLRGANVIEPVSFRQMNCVKLTFSLSQDPGGPSNVALYKFTSTVSGLSAL